VGKRPKRKKKHPGAGDVSVSGKALGKKRRQEVKYWKTKITGMYQGKPLRKEIVVSIPRDVVMAGASGYPEEAERLLAGLCAEKYLLDEFGQTVSDVKREAEAIFTTKPKRMHDGRLSDYGVLVWEEDF
jgi:hypothetical protein